MGRLNYKYEAPVSGRLNCYVGLGLGIAILDSSTVGKLVDADMGIFNINAANSTGTSNEGNNDTSSYEKDIVTIVHAEYEVK